MLKRSLAATVAVAALAAGSMTAGAVGHPDHQLDERGNGPAQVDNGLDRGNPNGSNGTIKIDGTSFDGHPNNEPHIANCGFQVDFYGFDEGDTATLTFYRWPGTGDKNVAEAMIEIAADGGVGVDNVAGEAFPIGGDGAGGGIDIDQQVLVSLLGNLGKEHARHGYHIRAEADITSGDRTYTKTKVFWVSGDCELPSGSNDWPFSDLPT